MWSPTHPDTHRTSRAPLASHSQLFCVHAFSRLLSISRKCTHTHAHKEMHLPCSLIPFHVHPLYVHTSTHRPRLGRRESRKRSWPVAMRRCSESSCAFLLPPPSRCWPHYYPPSRCWPHYISYVPLHEGNFSCLLSTHSQHSSLFLSHQKSPQHCPTLASPPLVLCVYVPSHESQATVTFLFFFSVHVVFSQYYRSPKKAFSVRKSNSC